MVDRDALIERYRKEIEDLKTRLAEREVEAPVRNRRLSAREVLPFPSNLRSRQSFFAYTSISASKSTSLKQWGI